MCPTHGLRVETSVVGIRAALIEACRLRGIFAVEAGSLAVSALLLDTARRDDWRAHEPAFRTWVDLAIHLGIEEQRSEAPEDEIQLVPSSADVVQHAPSVESRSEEAEEAAPTAGVLRASIQGWFAALDADARARLGMEVGWSRGSARSGGCQGTRRRS